MLGVPVQLILRDSHTHQEVLVPTEQVIMEVENHYSSANLLRASEDMLTSRTITITADFVNMSERMRRPQPRIEERRQIE